MSPEQGGFPGDGEHVVIDEGSGGSESKVPSFSFCCSTSNSELLGLFGSEVRSMKAVPGFGMKGSSSLSETGESGGVIGSAMFPND